MEIDCPNPVPDEKSKKYDRQLRLWGDHGQSLLENAKVCLVNANATGSETLKNLILPGVGGFTILDQREVRPEDVGNNFFLDVESIGKRRGQVACNFLQELNEDVTGEYVDEDLPKILQKMPEFFLKFTLVIVSSLKTSLLEPLAEYLWNHSIPLFVCRSYGMLGSLRIVIRGHTVVESHPDNAMLDLRLTKPFPELVHYCDSIHLDDMQRKEHHHVPWLVLVYKYLQQYKIQHSGQLPRNYAEKKELKTLISKGMKRSEEGTVDGEENFEEAMRSVNTALHEPSISSQLRDILDDPLAQCTGPEVRSFWVLVKSLRSFIDRHGSVPLSGSIPDMTADSESYIRLQQIYKREADRHANEIHASALNILQELQTPKEMISFEDTKLFCRNAGNLAVFTTPSIADENKPSDKKIKILGSCLEDFDSTDDAIYYLILQAVDKFEVQYNRYPGIYDDHIEADIPLLKTEAVKILQDCGLSSVSISEDYIHEVCSYGGSEAHFVAAYMGGVISQEGIKIITRQYLPVNNTFIYNAMTQSSVTLDL